MKAFFRPAISLMDRLSYTGKYLLLGVAMALVLLILLAMVYVHLKRGIDATEQELVSLRILKPVNIMVQYMQQHRGLSSGVLNGNEAMKARRAEKEKEVDAALAEVKRMLSPTLSKSPTWVEVEEDWQTIRRSGLNWAAPENLKHHSEMIAKALTFMVDIADEMRLTADPDEDTHYLMDIVVNTMPTMLEPLGIARARGTGVLTRKELPLQLRVDIATLASQITGTLQAQDKNLTRAMHYAPSLEAPLSGPTREFTAGTEKILALVREDILGERFATPAQDYFARTTEVIDLGYKIMLDTLFPHLVKRLEARQAAAWRNFALTLGLPLLIMGLIGYLAIGS